ncbi:MAG: DNA-binding protein WhiA [Oscillospiraceae bacterium]|jgi:DNA-binding protein WhiA|nr:DNA-binding protein WhiA [Oscillospiraceae bacterium]
MSFSSNVKAELSKRLSELDGELAECVIYGVLLYCNHVGTDGIKIVTESADFAKVLPPLFRRVFGADFDSGSGISVGGKYTVKLTDSGALRLIFDKYGCDPATEPSLRLNRAVPRDDDGAAALLRGAFLAGGSVTDPAKRYHLELRTNRYHVDRGMFSLLEELGLRPKSVTRNGSYTIYFKRSGDIEDALTLMGAAVSSMEHMNAKLEKGLRSSASREVNCVAANADKIANAAVEQLRAIKRLSAAGRLGSLTDALQRTAELRLNNEDASLAELAKLAGISKSGLAHRLRKLLEEAK